MLLKYFNLIDIMYCVKYFEFLERLTDMKKKNILAIVAIVLAFVAIFVALTCTIIAIGNEIGLFSEIAEENNIPEITESTAVVSTPVDTGVETD